jgi:drug/metabolite transporter superfamily protein YnfA
MLQRKDLLLFLFFLMACISLFGWLLGFMSVASFSLVYIPSAPSTSFVFICLSLLFIFSINQEKPWFSFSFLTFSILLITLFCSFILIDYLFDFKWDIENIFYRVPKINGNVPEGRMSPITSMLFIVTCISIFGSRPNMSKTIKYCCSSLSLLIFLPSSVLLTHIAALSS